VVVSIKVDGQTEFGAHAIGAGNKNGIFEFVPQGKQTAESTQTTNDFRAGGSLDGRFDSFDQCFAGIDVDARIAVGEWGMIVCGDVGRHDGAYFK